MAILHIMGFDVFPDFHPRTFAAEGTAISEVRLRPPRRRTMSRSAL
jgi:hypothetical protein